MIDRWCFKKCIGEHCKRHSRVFVATSADSDEVLGIYSLTISPLLATRGIRYHQKNIPAIYFDKLGVTKELQGNGIGAALMADAFQRTLDIAENVGVYCLWLTAIDLETCGFYEKLGFKRIDTRSKQDLDMYIPRSVIEDSLK